MIEVNEYAMDSDELSRWKEYEEAFTDRHRILEMEFWRCDACGWCGYDANEHVDREPDEFWGERCTRIAVTPFCPACGAEVEEATACHECNAAVAMDDDDLCEQCAKNDPSHDIHKAALLDIMRTTL